MPPQSIAVGRKSFSFLALLGACAGVTWENTPVLTDTWRAVSGGDFNTLLALTVSSEDGFAHTRAEDGRGPMWWAYEFKNPSALALFKHLGVSESERDGGGLLPSDTFDGTSEELEQLVADAEQRLPGIPAMLEQFAGKLDEMKRQQAARFDDDEPDQEGDLGVDLDDDEDEEDEDEEDDEAPPPPKGGSPDDIAARVAALKAKAQAIKDEI